MRQLRLASSMQKTSFRSGQSPKTPFRVRYGLQAGSSPYRSPDCGPSSLWAGASHGEEGRLYDRKMGSRWGQWEWEDGQVPDADPIWEPFGDAGWTTAEATISAPNHEDAPESL